MDFRLFTGSRTLSRFIFRRDRLNLPIWILSIVLFASAFIPIFKTILVPSESMSMLEMLKNPAMVALIGPVYGAENYTTGAAYGNMMLLFSVMIAGAMNIFFVARHTLQDEELGRLEVVRSLPIGRLSNLSATLLSSAIINLLLFVLTSGAMYALHEDGMTLGGCMLFAASLSVIGFFFSALMAVICQLTSNNRTGIALSMIMLFVLYFLRAIGDVSLEGLSLVSPLGLVLRTKVFVENNWLPIVLILLISVALCLLAFYFANRRDLGSGLLPEKKGKSHLSAFSSTPYGLAFRLTKSSIIIWCIVIFSFAGMYGSVFGDLDRFLSENEFLQQIFSSNPDFSFAEQFIVLLMVIMSMIGTIPVLSFINRVASEEKSGLAENILSKSVSRKTFMSAYVLPAFLISIIVQTLSALGFWSVGSMVLSTTPSLSLFLTSAFLYLPAMWCFLSLGILLIGISPSLSSLSYIYLGYAFFSVYLGKIAGLPEWLQKLSPFGNIPQYPIEEVSPLPITVCLLLSIAFAISGYYFYQRRDLKNH